MLASEEFVVKGPSAGHLKVPVSEDTAYKNLVRKKQIMNNAPMFRPALFLFLIIASASMVTYSQAPGSGKTGSESLTVPGERHLGNVRQLTFGGTNAEAYFSADDKYLIFMHSGAGVPCDQMYTCLLYTSPSPRD